MGWHMSNLIAIGQTVKRAEIRRKKVVPSRHALNEINSDFGRKM